MDKRNKLVLTLSAAFFLFILILCGNQSQNSKPTELNNNDNIILQKSKPICDGVSIQSNCEVDGVSYKTYIYHPAVPEKSHIETITTYRQQITGYCTLCNDGTYSPSCATGRGACSYHGGVAVWNAPVYSNVPEYNTKTVIDVPAKNEYYEKL